MLFLRYKYSSPFRGRKSVKFENNYRDKEDVHFIASGRTLEKIRKYLHDREHWEDAYAAIAKEYGAKQLGGFSTLPYMIFDKPQTHPALHKEAAEEDGTYFYEINPDTPEGKALRARIEDIPRAELGFNQFAKMLTGAEDVLTNPDNLIAPGHTGSGFASSSIAAYYRKYGETYVVSVPRVVRGIFNDASRKEADGYTYEWFTPPDSQQIPYSKVVELREKEKGDQLSPQSSTKAFGYTPRRTMQGA